MPLRLSVVFVFSFLLVTLLPARAFAQTVAITNKDSLARVAGDGVTSVTKRDSTLSREGVNLQDCHDNQFIEFPLTETFAVGDAAEIWATDQGGSSDCSDPAKRPGTPPACYKVGTFALSTTTTVTIPVKTLIRGTGDSATLDSQGCHLIDNATVTVYFMIFRGGTTTAAAGKDTAPIKVDTVGPAPLANVRAQPGNTRISVAWDSVGEAGGQDITGAQAFCDSSPVPVTAFDAGSSQVCTDADADPDAADGTATPEPSCTTVANEGGAAGDPIPQPPNIDSNGKACTTKAFAQVNGKNVVPDAKFSAMYGCGSITGTTGNTITIKDVGGAALANGRTYAVAVAGTDSFDNVGELSSPICQFPEETSDFWADYRKAGGQAGGSFCSIDGAGMPAGSFGFMAVGAAFGASALRRLRHRLQRGRNKR